ncbi:MAG: hypothetical protein WA970_06810 [Gammaproteobacteria bacterium]
MINKRYVLYVILALTGVAQAQEGEGSQTDADPKQSIDLLFSDKTIEGRYFRDVGYFGNGTQKLLLGGYLNTDNSFQFTGGISTEVLEDFTPLKSDLQFSLGSRLYISRLADPSDNIFGLGFGAGWNFTFPERILKLPLTLRGNYYYVPEVLTSGDNQDILDFDIVEAQLDLTKNLAGIFGFREMTVANRNLDNNWNLGVRYKF